MLDTELRTLARWDLDRDEMSRAQKTLSRANERAKAATQRVAALRAEIQRRCPLELSEIELRFWSKVDVVDDDDSCWLWTAATRNVEGERYGSFHLELADGLSITSAHRAAYFLTTGEIPDHTLHSCDNPTCVRPKHLRNGTHRENMRDRKERGRFTPRDQRGERNAFSVLTEEIVTGARIAMRDDPELRIEMVANNYRVPRAALYQAVIGRSWTHLDTPPLEVGQRGKGKLSPENVQRLRALLADGKYSRDELAAMFGIDPSAVSYHRRAMKLPDRRTKAGRHH